MLVLQRLALLAVLAVAPPAAAGPCPDDCSLNGACVGGKCHCAAPWTGPTCGRFLTAAAKPGGLYGYSPNVSSWGGSLVTDANGTHHLFAAEIPGGLLHWGTNSQCIHAVSKDLQGPFIRKDTALRPWCHGPQVVVDPASSHYIMTHVGTGQSAPSRPPSPSAGCLKTNTCPPAAGGSCPAEGVPGWKCFPGVCGADGDAKMGRCGTDITEPSLACDHVNISACAVAAAAACEKTSGCGAFSLAKIWRGLGQAKLFSQNTTRVPTTGWTSWVRTDMQTEKGKKEEPSATADGSGFMHHSATPDGPWLPASTSPGSSCGMPSLAFHPNGTLFVICGNGHAITRVISSASTPVWEAEWSPQVKLMPHGLQGNWE